MALWGENANGTVSAEYFHLNVVFSCEGQAGWIHDASLKLSHGKLEADFGSRGVDVTNVARKVRGVRIAGGTTGRYSIADHRVVPANYIRTMLYVAIHIA